MYPHLGMGEAWVTKYGVWVFDLCMPALPLGCKGANMGYVAIPHFSFTIFPLRRKLARGGFKG